MPSHGRDVVFDFQGCVWVVLCACACVRLGKADSEDAEDPRPPVCPGTILSRSDYPVAAQAAKAHAPFQDNGKQ